MAWRAELTPARERLLAPLSAIFRDQKRGGAARDYATDTLAEFAFDRPDELFDLLADSEERQFAPIFSKLAAHKDEAIKRATQEVSKTFPQDANEDQKEVLAKRQANAAVALLRLGAGEPVWPLLKASPDPRVRSYIVNWLGPRGGDPRAILQRLQIEPDVTIRRALLLTLGQFDEAQLPVAERQTLIRKLLTIYEHDPDPGLHGAAEWLLRKWGQEKALEAVLTKLACDETQLRARGAKPSWYVNTQKQTFIAVDADKFVTGSPRSEPGFSPQNAQLTIHIGRTFVISAHEITRAQYRAFQRQLKVPAPASDLVYRNVLTDDSAQTAIGWVEAVHYCDWLSEQEKIPRDQWCYDPKDGVYGPGMKAKDRFWDLTGYRLPTQAEWEFT